MSDTDTNLVLCTRRSWLMRTGGVASYGMVVGALRRVPRLPRPPVAAATLLRVEQQTVPMDPAPLFTLAEQAVDAARSGGASYADARLTRTVIHRYEMSRNGQLEWDEELIGVGVRVLAHGAWGFAASPLWTTDEAVRLAHDAVRQATSNTADDTPPVELAPAPRATGTWSTPIRIDPFTIPIEEKLDHIVYWKARAQAAGIPFYNDGQFSGFGFVRREQVLVTSEGTRVVQTRYETDGSMTVGNGSMVAGSGINLRVKHLESAGAGWEYLLALPDQFPALQEELQQRIKQQQQLRRERSPFVPFQVGRYTIICDGTIMAQMLDRTLGTATQLDRALGYEANASGTSYLDDPLDMLGQAQVASPVVTITANRSAPQQLATVKWDDEGVEPVDTIVVKNGVLTDFQTTRELASWLAPYYAKAGRPARSNGYGTAEDALSITMQQQPNLALTPGPAAVTIDAMAASVPNGLLLEGGSVTCDFQGRSGVIFPERMRQVKNGRIGKDMPAGGILFNTTDFWKHITAVGAASTQALLPHSQFADLIFDVKGEPGQRTSHTIVSPAALITNQILIDPNKKA